MDAVTLLKNQHREVEELFARYDGLGDRGSNTEKKAVLAELARKLIAHTVIEERLFYPEGREADEQMTLEAYEEHAIVKDMIKKLAKLRINDESLDAKVKVLKDIVEHHVDEEEEEYFPECEDVLGEERLEELGLAMEELYERLLASGGRRTTRQRVTQPKTSSKKRRKAA